MALTRTRSPDRPVLRGVLAAVFLAMAAAQVSDVGGFADILREYRVFPDPLARLVAVAFPVAEAIAGIGMLRRSSHAATLGLVVVAVWSALALSAFSRGLALENCGCFGVHLGQPLRWWVLLEDAEWAVLTVLARRSLRGVRDAAPGDTLETRAHRPAPGLRRR